MREVYICDAVRTPIGRFGGALASIRADDLAAVPLKALIARNPGVHWAHLDEVFFGCANQAGEDNRNVARMALLLAGLPECVPGVTLNRLCASGMEAVGAAFRAIACGEMELAIARGVDVASAVCHGQSAKRLFTHHATGRHHHRLAFRQPAHESAIRRGCHAADGGQRS